MPASTRRLVSNMISDLKQERDELSVQIHLGKQEVKQEWEKLDDKLNKLNHRFDPFKDAVAEAGDDVWDAMKNVGEEIKAGFRRIRKEL
jgi:hypothetical protein